MPAFKFVTEVCQDIGNTEVRYLVTGDDAMLVAKGLNERYHAQETWVYKLTGDGHWNFYGVKSPE
jgi:hypothetical protein